MNYANDFSEIPSAVKNNEKLRESIIYLIERENVSGKVIEGEGRLEAFRIIMISFFNGDLDVFEAAKEVEFRLPRHYSPYENNNRVFPLGWAERIVRTAVSCYYNQAVLVGIINSGSDFCFVEHSANEQRDSNCSRALAGKQHLARVLLERLVDSYRSGNWSNEVKIPDHPHCTHTVRPV